MIIYGKNPIKEAIFAKRPIFELFLDEKFKDYHYLEFLKDKNIRYTLVSKERLNKLTANEVHQGIVANVKDYEYYDLDFILNNKEIEKKPNKKRVLILDSITDPHNLGAILRTAEAVNIDAIIVNKHNTAPLNQTVAKVSVGAIEHVKIVLVTNLVVAIKKLQENNFIVVATDGNAKKSYKEIPKEDNIAIIVGNEGDGIRKLVKDSADILVKIPMNGKINSLNVSVAAALMLYEVILI